MLGRSLGLFLCAISLFAMTVQGQNSGIAQIHVESGTVLSFHVQNRLNPSAADVLNVLPKGSVLKIRILNSVDSTLEQDGTPFQGSVVSSLVSGNRVVVHSHASARGLLALLRSRNHPDGFRYELLITRLTDHGRSYALTASLDPSFQDLASKTMAPQTEAKENSNATGLIVNKLPKVMPE
jgi:hypothetical protein